MDALLLSHFSDETPILTSLLQQIGFSVRAIREWKRVIEVWQERTPDILLVASTEDADFYTKEIMQLRLQTVIPIVLITDRVPEEKQVNLLDAGADLVITRPYGTRLLIAQIKGLLRRSEGLPYHSLPSLTQSDVSLDPTSRTVKVGVSPPKRLTQLEFRLLYTLITQPGRIMSAENLVEHVWGYSGEGNRELVRGLVQRLRSKVEPDPRNPVYILTEPGVGYYFSRESS
jgi:DNA-binding response OmpR family regulator